MKLALCTTTIHVPHALKLMRKCSSDVKFFVAVDKKTPEAALEFCAENGAEIVWGDGWKCSEAIGWNTLARRNIAFLDALKWGADAIYSWDNDNIPVGLGHFDWIHMRLDSASENKIEAYCNFNGIKAQGGVDRWFDPGELLIPKTRHRGHPYDIKAYTIKTSVTDARIGVAAGLVLGDPDIDAVTRMEKAPDIQSVGELGHSGIVVDPQTWTVFNSQNTAVIRELIPAWFMGPGLGRHDDIFASLVVQRVMRERGYHVHFGLPFTLQQRNEHDLLSDLCAEINGMKNVTNMAELLDSIILPARSVIDDTRIIYGALEHAEWYPKQAVVAARAWLEDCESVI